MAKALVLLALAAFPAAPQALGVASTSAATANPIRKVVNLLQALQKKVTEEGEQEAKLYEKFECYCQTSGSSLGDSISAAETKVPSLEADIKSQEEEKVQLEGDLKQAKEERVAAQAAVAEATALREKESAAFAATKAEYDSDLAAISKALAALEKGASGGFLQTGAGRALRAFIISKDDMLEADRSAVLSFLSGSAAYAPSSGQVIGILTQLRDEMSQSLADVTATEKAAIEAYEGLKAAKEKEIAALTEAIETKTQRAGELAVSVVQLKNDLGDTQEALAADRGFLANLDTTCSTKKTEWEERQKTRSSELVALSDTIKMLNEDSALDLFKATLAAPAVSLVQLTATAKALRSQAAVELRRVLRAQAQGSVHLDRVLLALEGKQGGFEKVLSLIDGMVETLHKEQADDESKKEYCGKEFGLAEDKHKELEHSASTAEAATASAQEALARVTEEIAALQSGIQALDKSVAQATEQRKKEHEEYAELIASNSQAKELLGMAKNRLHQFYHPALAAPTQAPAAPSLVQVHLHVQRREAPPPPPETFGAYAKKSEDASGVLAMLDLLVKDLDKEITEAEAEEKDAQADYETLTKDAAAKRAADAQSLSEKESSRASLEGSLEAHKEAKASATRELAALSEYVHALHGECDWLLQHFEARKEARGHEIEGLARAKDVLSGASYALLETGARRALRGRK